MFKIMLFKNQLILKNCSNSHTWAVVEMKITSIFHGIVKQFVSHWAALVHKLKMFIEFDNAFLALLIQVYLIK